MSKPRARIRIDLARDFGVGPGKIGLLEGIERTGSLSGAARALGMSYRRAWLLLHSTNEAFQEPVAELAVGGKDGGGARLTDFGRRLVADFREFEREVDAMAAERFGELRVTGRPAPGQGVAKAAYVAPRAASARTRKTRTTG